MPAFGSNGVRCLRMNKKTKEKRKKDGLCFFCRGQALPGLTYCQKCKTKMKERRDAKVIEKRGIDTSDPLLIYRSPKGVILKRPIRIGDKYGEFTILGLGEYVGNQMGLRCQCSCGMIKNVVWPNLLKGVSTKCGFGIHARIWNPDREDRALNSILSRYKANAKRRGYTWELTKEEFHYLIRQPCTYCGRKPEHTIKHWEQWGQKQWPTIYWNGVDRLDNSKGYSSNNSVACCRTCNKAKLDTPAGDFLQWVQEVYIHSIGKEKLVDHAKRTQKEHSNG